MSSIPSIVIEQRVDAAGRPALQTWRREIEGTVVLPPRSVAIDLLVRLRATPRADRDFDYRDAERGAGIARLEGFSEADETSIRDFLRVRQLGAEIGMPLWALPWLDTYDYAALARPPRNPVVAVIVFAAAALLFLVSGAVTAVRAAAGELVPLMPVLFFACALLLCGIAIFHGRRLGWWLKARALVRSNGERMPSGLRGAE